MEQEQHKKHIAVLTAVAVLLLLVILWTVWFFVSPIRLQREAEALLGREDVVALDSWHTPWLYVEPNGKLHIKRERVWGDTLVIPDVMDGVAVTSLADTGGRSNGIKEISLPPAITTVTFWNGQFSDVRRLVFRSGCSLGKELELYRFSVGIELCLPREILLLEAEAFRKCDKSLVIRYAGTEQEWLALGEDAAVIAADYTVLFDGEK